MTTLHDYWRSTASYRVRICLGLAGVEWNTIPVNLLENQHSSDDYLAINPQGFVPTISIDDICLTQSLAIVEYLNETRQRSQSLPNDSNYISYKGRDERGET